VLTNPDSIGWRSEVGGQRSEVRGQSSVPWYQFAEDSQYKMTLTYVWSHSQVSFLEKVWELDLIDPRLTGIDIDYHGW